MSSFVNAAYDEASLAHIVNLRNFSKFLHPQMSAAMVKIGEIVVQAAQANTWEVFKNPTGDLAGSIIAIPNGPLEIDVGSNLGYARRLEEGFSGTDSLGRVYSNEPEPYLMPALEQNQDEIVLLMQEAAAEAMAKMGVRI